MFKGVRVELTEEAREKAIKSRLRNIEEGKRIYKQDWLDDVRWVELAKMYNVKLPQKHIAPKAYKLRKIAKELGLDDDWEEAFFGIGRGNIQKNIDEINNGKAEGCKYNLRAYVGWLLEYKHTNM